MRGTLSGPNGAVATFDPEGGKGPIVIADPGDIPSGSGGFFWNMAFEFVPLGISLFLKEGTARAGKIVVESISSVLTSLIDVVLLNGFSLKAIFPTGTIPDYFKPGNPFRNELKSLGLNDNSIKAIALFEESRIDILQWFLNQKLSFEIQQEFNTIKKAQPDHPFVPLAYSGAGRPLLDALAYNNGFDIKTAIMVGTPLMPEDAVVRSPSLEKVINIFGSDDIFYNLQDPPSIPTIFTSDSRSIETINIQLLDIHHREYFYNNSETPTPEQVKALKFIANLTRKLSDPTALNLFLKNFNNSLVENEVVDPSTGIKHMICTYAIDTKNLSDGLL